LLQPSWLHVCDHPASAASALCAGSQVAGS
jgi:hypothetical protein